MNRTMVGFAGAVAAAVLSLAAAPASAQQPVAVVFMYEVSEGLSFKAPKHVRNPADAQRRLADATLLGKKIVPLTTDPASPWAAAHFISADAHSSVSLTTGRGPIGGTFDLLQDIDPARESLDTLVISGSGSLRGVLDLRTATQGYARASGTWQIKKSPPGTFSGVFLIPFPIAPDVYAYLDVSSTLELDQMGLSLCANPIPLSSDPAGPKGCVLGSDEFALGIPLTKAVLILSQ